MGSIIVALPKLEDAKHISDVMRGCGLETTMVCTSGRELLPRLGTLENGVIICGRRVNDMHYTKLAEYLPEYFDMVLLSSASGLEDIPPGVMRLTFPIRAGELVSTVEMLLLQHERRLKKKKLKPKKRSEKEQKIIDAAKKVLMERNQMTEQEAFRYIQKSSMDSETNMVETAQMILLLIHDE